jgi:hypothetical protein
MQVVFQEEALESAPAHPRPGRSHPTLGRARGGLLGHPPNDCRLPGALNGLMAEVIEGHIRFHIVDPNHQPTSPRARAAQELIEVVQTYLK